jgi:hypothetical protein
LSGTKLRDLRKCVKIKEKFAGVLISGLCERVVPASGLPPSFGNAGWQPATQALEISTPPKD